MLIWCNCPMKWLSLFRLTPCESTQRMTSRSNNISMWTKYFSVTATLFKSIRVYVYLNSVQKRWCFMTTGLVVMRLHEKRFHRRLYSFNSYVSCHSFWRYLLNIFDQAIDTCVCFSCKQTTEVEKKFDERSKNEK